MTEFKIGDVVKLKSGSPTMTIKRKLGDNQIECTWFEDAHGVQKDVFHEDMLKIYNPPPRTQRVAFV